MSHTPLGPGPEFDMIRGIWNRIGDRASPSGDDCAFFEVGREQLAISSDLSVEGTHFQVGWMNNEETGWRAATAGLSDLAAVAATPLGMTVSVGTSDEQPDDHVAELMKGAADAAEAAGAMIWGGDTVWSEWLVLDVTVVGRMEKDPVTRGGAEVGDGLFVTGVLGGPAAALGAWEDRREPDAAARDRFVRPVARIAEAQWLRDAGARAMIDVSDGLLADTGHLVAASNVACVLDIDAVPVHPAAAGPEEAITSGEEYELLLALPDGVAAAGEFSERFGLSLTRVGRVEAGSGVRVERDGTPVDGLETFRHF